MQKRINVHNKGSSKRKSTDITQPDMIQSNDIKNNTKDQKDKMIC